MIQDTVTLLGIMLMLIVLGTALIISTMYFLLLLKFLMKRMFDYDMLDELSDQREELKEKYPEWSKVYLDESVDNQREEDK
jgi:hypothetical protein